MYIATAASSAVHTLLIFVKLPSPPTVSFTLIHVKHFFKKEENTKIENKFENSISIYLEVGKKCCLQ